MTAAKPVPVSEPTTLGELYKQAQVDLERPVKGAILRWAAWKARAVGRLKVAEIMLNTLNEQERIVRATCAGVIQASIRAEVLEQVPSVAVMAQAREVLVESAAYVDLAESVLKLLGAQ